MNNLLDSLEPLTTEDMGKELVVSSPNPSNYFFQFYQPNGNYRFRLLGPFVQSQRIFLPNFFKDVPTEILRLALKGHEDSIDQICELLYQKGRVNQDNFAPIVNQMKQKSWTRCLLVNAMQRTPQSPKVQVLALTKAMISQIPNSLVISGLNAHDITISKRSFESTPNRTVTRLYGVPAATNGQTNYDPNSAMARGGSYVVTISPTPEMLKEEETQTILDNGLIDIHPVVKLMNSHNLNRKVGFIYKTLPKYVMPAEFNTCLPEIDKITEEAKMTAIESEVENLPSEVYGGEQRFNNPISSLELD